EQEPPRTGSRFTTASFVRADADGRFVFEDASRVELLVVGIAKEHGRLAPGSARVPAGAADAAVDRALPAGATLRGTVRKDGKPPRGAAVHAWAVEPAEPMGYLTN